MQINPRIRAASYLVTTLCLGLLPLQARANGLIGTSVTGDLNFSGFSANYYDPANGFVPSSGYLNASGTTVSIASPAVEFGFQDDHNTDSANFSASQFTIEDVLDPTAGGTDNSVLMTFTDAAFAGQTLVKATDSFPNGGLTFSVSGDQITVSWAGGPINANDDYTSTFQLKAVPEPSSWAMLGLGAGAIALVLHRKRAAQV